MIARSSIWRSNSSRGGSGVPCFCSCLSAESTRTRSSTMVITSSPTTATMRSASTGSNGAAETWPRESGKEEGKKEEQAVESDGHGRHCGMSRALEVGNSLDLP